MDITARPWGGQVPLPTSPHADWRHLQCCGKAATGWRVRPQVDRRRALGQSRVRTWRKPGGPCGECYRQAPWVCVLPGRWGAGVWVLAQEAAGAAGSLPAACGSRGRYRNIIHGVLAEDGVPAPVAVVLTSLCSRRSSSLRLLLTFMSCCTLASEVARAFFSSRYSCSVTAPSDRSEESMLCRGGGTSQWVVHRVPLGWVRVGSWVGGSAQTRARLLRAAPVLRRGSWSVSSSEATLS